MSPTTPRTTCPRDPPRIPRPPNRPGAESGSGERPSILHQHHASMETPSSCRDAARPTARSRHVRRSTRPTSLPPTPESIRHRIRRGESSLLPSPYPSDDEDDAIQPGCRESISPATPRSPVHTTHLVAFDNRIDQVPKPARGSALHPTPTPSGDGDAVILPGFDDIIITAGAPMEDPSPRPRLCAASAAPREFICWP